MDFESIRKTLKSEFIGIDSQIDTIIDIIRPWYHNPELYNTPCIINLWGMTGHGKTSLINRIIDLMEEGHNRLYMNCHSMVNQDLYFMDDFMDDNTTNSRSNKFIIFDDFQYVRTVNDDGDESSSSSLSMMWNLMDTGVINEAFGSVYFKIVGKIVETLNKVQSPDEINKGEMADIRKLLPIKYVMNPEICQFYLPPKKGYKTTPLEDKKWSFFLTPGTLGSVTYICRQLNMDDAENDDTFIYARHNWNAFEWRDFFNELYSKMKKGQIRDYHNSVIFVIGNIDEAFYGTAKLVNPEMSADQIYEITKKINIVDIKKGLQKRFRNEQIARLGNTHIIYPSFNNECYNAIISKYLNAYADKFKSISGIELVFDDKLKECIYNEGVFPSQGVRPLFSTINDIVKSNVPKAIDAFKSDDSIDFNSVKSVECSFDIDAKQIKFKAVAKDNNNNLKTIESNIKIYLRVRDSYKDNHEEQVDTSVHESGHFILYKYLTGNAPTKVLSRSLESSCLGYMMEKFDEGVSSKKRLTDEITVCLGGYVAEYIVFGDEYRSSGASEDIENATSIASSMIKQYGFNGSPILYTQESAADNENTVKLLDKDLEITNVQIKNIIRSCFDTAVFLLKHNEVLRKCFIESSEILSEKGELTDADINRISAAIETADGYSPVDNNHYSKALDDFSKELV